MVWIIGSSLEKISKQLIFCNKINFLLMRISPQQIIIFFYFFRDIDRLMLWKIRYMKTTAVFVFFSFIAFILNLIILSFFWCAAKYVIWTINIAFIFGLLLFSAYLAKINKMCGVAGVCVIIAAVCLVIWLRKKINIVINIIAESIKVVFKFWILLVLPFVVRNFLNSDWFKF